MRLGGYVAETGPDTAYYMDWGRLSAGGAYPVLIAMATARQLGATSEFGKEYDSLADVVTFGAAPAVLVYAWGLHVLGNLGAGIAFLFLVAVSLRLARFNVMTGKTDSTLAKAADVVLDVGVREEACPLGLAPTASTTAALAMGDALAIVLLEHKGFKEEDFALRHPGPKPRQIRPPAPPDARRRGVCR